MSCGGGGGGERTCLLCLCILPLGYFYLFCTVMMCIENLVRVLGGRIRIDCDPSNLLSVYGPAITMAIVNNATPLLSCCKN